MNNHLPAETPVWHTGLAEWVKATTVPEIAAELPPPVPAVALPAPDAPLPRLPEDVGSADAAQSEQLSRVVPVDLPDALALEGRHHRRRRHRHRPRGSEPRWDLLAILAVALIVLVMVLWRMFRQGDAIPSGIVGLG